MNNPSSYEDSPPSYPGSAAGGRGYVSTLYIARDYACILVVGVIMGLMYSGRGRPDCSSL